MLLRRMLAILQLLQYHLPLLLLQLLYLIMLQTLTSSSGIWGSGSGVARRVFKELMRDAEDAVAVFLDDIVVVVDEVVDGAVVGRGCC